MALGRYLKRYHICLVTTRIVEISTTPHLPRPTMVPESKRASVGSRQQGGRKARQQEGREGPTAETTKQTGFHSSCGAHLLRKRPSVTSKLSTASSSFALQTCCVDSHHNQHGRHRAIMIMHTRTQGNTRTSATAARRRRKKITREKRRETKKRQDK